MSSAKQILSKSDNFFWHFSKVAQDGDQHFCENYQNYSNLLIKFVDFGQLWKTANWSNFDKRCFAELGQGRPRSIFLAYTTTTRAIKQIL